MNELLDRLETLGFFRFVPTEEISDMRQSIIKTKFLYYEARREWNADAEELAEGGVSWFINDNIEILNAIGVHLQIQIEDLNIGGEYNIQINDFYFRIYSEEELQSKDIWELSQLRTIGIMNYFLRLNNTEERLYSLDGGNDGTAVLLTPKMHSLIAASGLFPKREIPQPVDIYPPTQTPS